MTNMYSAKTFQSTLSQGERRYVKGVIDRNQRNFNPRSRKESDAVPAVVYTADTDFNPRSRKESDQALTANDS